jgi:lipopolysaccharide/colanic/teichoic acid biosynthesis glycosyltransferase
MSVKERKRVAPRPHHSTSATARPRQASNALSSPAYFRWKAILDRVFATLLLLLGLPLIALLVLLVRLSSRGPGIYRQVRVGRDGRRFSMYKIRTMRHDAELATGPVWTQTTHDPRITPIGRVLRKFHLDEVPQLLNVVKGEMSMVGPRPERPEFVRVLAESIPGYRNRLAVLPGITGLAQLNLPPDSDLNSVRCKLALDCEYIRQAGPWLDARLFLCTGLRMLKVSEHWVLHFFGLARDVSFLEIPDTGACGGGNGNGNGAGHAPPTPANILHEAGAESTDSGNRHVKDAHAHRAPIKPR